MKRFGMIAALVWFSVVALAHQDRVAIPGEFAAEFEGGDRVRMRVKDAQVSTLILEEASGRRLVVPEAALAGIVAPDFTSVQVRWSDRPPVTRKPYKYVRIWFGTEADRAFGEMPKVDFMFRDGSYSGRTIWRKTGANAWGLEREPDDLGMPAGSAYAAAVRLALRGYGGRPAGEVAASRYSKGEYGFILVGGFSIYAPGDFQLGGDLILRPFPTRIFPTTDGVASEEEAKVFAEAGEFAKRFNETMFSLMLSGGQLVVHEVEYVVRQDARIVVNYLSGETLSLRDKAGKTRVVWLDKPDGLLVKRGVIEEVRREQVTRFPFADGLDVGR